MLRSLLFLVIGVVGLCTTPLAAQDAVLAQLYGNGVHAYFGQDYVKAHQLLTSAIDGRTQDPRTFYFRGLALIRLGRPEEADKDFDRGAALESSSDAPRAYDVARALERVQGPERAKLEERRLTARMAVLKKADDDRVHRYQANIKEQRDFLQRQSEAGPGKADVPAVGGGEAPKAGGAKAGGDPFTEGEVRPTEKKEPATDIGTGAKPDAPAATGAETPAEKPAGPAPTVVEKSEAKAETTVIAPGGAAPAAEPPKADDPFGGGTTPVKKPDTPKPAAEDPFGGPAATPDKKSETPKPAAGDDPFGGGTAAPAKKADAPKPAADNDSFGGGADAPKPAAPAKKADAPKPAAGDDPLGGGAATPAKKADAPKPAAGDDPFGGGADAAKPAAPAKKADAPKPAAGDDPLASDDAAKPAAPAKKADAPKPAAGDDPFGDAPKPAADAKKPPDDKKEAKTAEEKKPADAGDDPFK